MRRHQHARNRPEGLGQASGTPYIALTSYYFYLFMVADAGWNQDRFSANPLVQELLARVERDKANAKKANEYYHSINLLE